jgi:hypothetical protein
MELLPKQYRITQIYGDYWFNSEPVPVGAHQGYVILVEFWDYTCSRCIQSLPYLREWYARYHDAGLMMIGVHTPQFPFGRDPLIIRDVIEKHDIRFPVVMDNEYIVWSAFRAQTWPTRVLVDRSGFIRYIHSGEGSYLNFEHAIQSLLIDAGYHDDLPLVMEPLREIDRPGALCYRQTPDILTGWRRGTIGNVEGFSPESTVHYEDPGYHLPGRLYLQGNWLNDRDSIRFNSDGEGYVVFSYEGKEVSAVIKPEGEKNFQVRIEQDGQPLTAENRGSNVVIGPDGTSSILVDQADIFQLVRNPEYGEHTIRITTRSKGFALYAVSFLSAVIPEVISNN